MSLENALQKGTFDVLEAAKGRGYPTETVTLYTAFVAEYEARKIEKRLATDTLTDEERLELETRFQACVDEIKASALTFHLRGVSPGVIDAIHAEAEAKRADESDDTVTDDQSQKEFAADKITATHIVKVVDAQGAEDTAEWTTERFRAFADLIPDGETIKLVGAVSSLTFESAAFDEVVGPDFSLKR